MCKRVMQRVAKGFSERMECGGIVMGDSLGQVASQTLKNIKSENVGLNFPVVRPLIGYDKLEIEAIAKNIGTYDISIEPISGCTLVPIRPITEARAEKIECFDGKMDLDSVVSDLLDKIVKI
jgi:thiamine biosynthesis protein ThiI